MTSLSNCPNCKRGFLASADGAYCPECWSAWSRNDGSFEERTQPWPKETSATATVDVDHNQLDSFLAAATRSGLTHEVLAEVGPGGGNPHVALHGVDRGHLWRFLRAHYDPEMPNEDFDLYCAEAA
jgi:Uncharacterized Zn-ribbon-containing protein involved in phosphonate metabolism